MTKTILGVDPGSSKVGLAIVEGDHTYCRIAARAVVEVSELAGLLPTFADPFSLSFAVIGNGTNSRDVQQMLREALPSVAIMIVDERDTSIRAREKYWEHNPRRGWRRILPSSLQVPPVPVDDYSAAILAERALKVE